MTSASERLRALWAAAEPWYVRHEGGNENIIASNHYVDTMADLGPLIADVVEAAELTVKLEDIGFPGKALERRLAALRDALEEK